ncbi:GlyGly-CTERM sorting domain-containing protein [Ferrimonas sediminicola]|uniref:GlyGly-CTERM sorting domain-containing protein n=1 Tax=Ferrimonas sediminicola TaxID=2569538 RepID=A0A4U1BB45_9GAMM|nr:endonuclease [Ferrimonas sediminicola]TKB48124.1 GlyGly-CTERM sorting domain-containing protein [Ferrimonas sediminicola]
MTIKLNAVATATAMILGTLSTVANANLVITEYVEGSSSNKALEISNVGNSTIDLDANVYKLNLYFNGKTEVGKTETLTGTLDPGKSIVYHNSSAADAFKVDTASEITWFNGDDTIVLTKDDAVIDRIGKLGEDPGSAWSDPNNADFSTANKTLRRKASVTEGDKVADADFPGSGDQWVVLDQDTSDGLGCAGEAACSSEATPGVLLITEYVEGSSSNKAVEISNVGGTAINLDANVYKLTLFGNGGTDPGNTETLTGTLEPGKSIVFHNASAADEFKVGTASTVTYFNGNDALVLTKDDVVVDRFGKRGEDPGSAWSDPNDANFSTANKTLRRKASVTEGDAVAEADFPGTDNQWLVFDQDTFDGLGCAGETACPAEPEPTDPCTGCETLTPVADPKTFNGDAYYSNVLNGDFKTADDLKKALSTIIATGHKQLTYKQVWTALTYTDQDPGNDKNVIELYTGASISKHDNQTSGSGAGKWNREHVWAKSHGFPSESQWGYTDAHHLRPADTAVNTKRSNNDFGECSDSGEEIVFDGRGTGNYLDTAKDCFEPRDAIKGDVARMMLYMDTRYQGSDGSMPNLTLVDRTTTADELSANAPVHGTLCLLYKWHQDDPVDAADQQRNDAVYTYQGNRNPYIDRPELVKEVYGAACGDGVPALVVEGEITAPESVIEGAAFTLDASAITAGEGKILTFKWEQIAGEEKTLVGNDAVLSLTAPMVKADTALQFTLTISDGTLDTTEVINLPVTNVPLTLDITFDGNTKLTEGDSTSITATVANAPEGLTYSWKQVSGATAEFTANGPNLDVTSPQVDINQALVFELAASNEDESYKTTVSIDVQNTEEAGWRKPDGAGSFGGLMTLLLPLVWLRRRQS